MKINEKDNQKKSAGIGDKVTYFYIKNVKKWMFCPACKNGTKSIDSDYDLADLCRGGDLTED